METLHFVLLTKFKKEMLANPEKRMRTIMERPKIFNF